MLLNKLRLILLGSDVVKDVLKVLLLSAVAYFAPTERILITVMALTIADLITGLLAARKQSLPITSSELKRTVLKIFIYQVAVLLAYAVQTELTGPDMPVMKWLTAIIGMVELKSILENLDIISGGSFFTSLTDKLQNILNNNTP